VWLPAPNCGVERLAVPLLSAAVPRLVAPSRKVTLPVAPGVTFAVSVNVWPATDGFGDAVSEVLLGARFTVTVAAALFAEPALLETRTQ
jgi:hypothetical protein